MLDFAACRKRTIWGKRQAEHPWEATRGKTELVWSLCLEAIADVRLECSYRYVGLRKLVRVRVPSPSNEAYTRCQCFSSKLYRCPVVFVDPRPLFRFSASGFETGFPSIWCQSKPAEDFPFFLC